MESYEMQYVFRDINGKKLDLEWTNDINYPFLSPFEVLITKGRPIGKIAYLILEYEEKQYAFGTIVHSVGDRFIFFSGLTDPRIYDTISKKKGELSHITLEANKDKFHIKFKDTKTKAPIFQTDEIEKDYYYWFSLALQHPTVLLPLKHLKFNFDFPKGDGKRRLNELGISRKGIINKILTLPENRLYDDEFIDFDFYITRQDIDDKYAICAFLFFKWLSEIKEFDKLNTLIFNVPIITIWQRWDGRIRMSQNIIGSDFYATNVYIYRRFKSILKWASKKLKRNADYAKKRMNNHKRKNIKRNVKLLKLEKKEVLAMKLRKLEKKKALKK